MQNIDGIWDNEYVLRLGVIDHLRELLIIDEEIKRLKNNRDEDFYLEAENSFNNECADLYLMLMKKFSGNEDIVLRRRIKFLEKIKND